MNSRSLARLVIVLLVVASALLQTTAAGAEDPAGFRATSEALGGVLSFPVVDRASPPGVVGGLSAATASGPSGPLAKSKGAGTCPNPPASGQSLIDLLCASGSTESAQVTDVGEQDDPPNPQKCNTPASPAPQLSLALACGNALARVVGPDPYGEGVGSLANVVLDLDAILPGGDAIVRLGTSFSKAGVGPGFATAPNVKAESGEQAGVVGLVCAITSDIDSCQIKIELGASTTEATWNGTTASATGAIGPIVVVLNGTAIATLGEGDSFTIPALAGTPLQTEVTVGTVDVATSNPASGPRSASAIANGVTIRALQGLGGSAGNACGTSDCDGGVLFNVGYSKATIEATRAANADASPSPNTGSSPTPLAPGDPASEGPGSPGIDLAQTGTRPNPKVPAAMLFLAVLIAWWLRQPIEDPVPE